jgi:hypothetical protein
MCQKVTAAASIEKVDAVFLSVAENKNISLNQLMDLFNYEKRPIFHGFGLINTKRM